MGKSRKSVRPPELAPEQLTAVAERSRANLKAGRPIWEGLSDDEALAVRTRYAEFEDVRDRQGFLTASHVVVKGLHTPRPFVHLMATSHDGLYGQWASFWDQHGGGFSALDSVGAGRMTSHLDTNYVPTSPEPQDARNFYIHEKGRAWPMFPVAGYEEDRYRRWSCRQGMDWLRLEVDREGLRSRLQVFVHKDLPLEVWQVTLTNRRKAPRDLAWFLRLRVNVDSFPFYYFVPRVVCEGVLEDGAQVFINHDKGNKHPRTAFLASEPAFDGYDMMGEVFEGGPGRAPLPSAVRRGACFNSLGLQPYQGFIAAAQYSARLAPGESRTWTVAYGAAPNDSAKRREFLARVRAEVLADGGQSALAAVAEGWRAKVAADAIQTPDPEIDRYFNVWSKYQIRSQARFIACLDKIGYRDVLQNLMTAADFDPAYVRAALVETVQYQFPDGRAVRQYEKFPNTGHDMRMYHDSPVWMPDTLVRYVKETGDRALLDEPVPFLDAETLRPSRTEVGTMYDHAARAVRSVCGHTGYHGLCRIGYGDWNDAISGIGGEKGVSVWLSCACVYAARIMAELAGCLGRAADQAEFQGIVAALTERINAHAWDGWWYIYAISGKGEPIGSARTAEGRIHLNVNTWALFSGVAAAAGREEAVWRAIGELATPLGHLLLRPSYTQASRPTVGRIADQVPGMFENGSVYTHGESFYLYALVCAGKADQWHKEVYQTLPSNLVPDISTAPPHQQSNFSVGPDHVACGTNLFSNFTGSVGWYRKTIERIVGVLPEFEALRIAPMPPKVWDHYQVRRTFRGCDLALDFRRGDRKAVLLDGKEVGDLIPASLLAGKPRAAVRVTYV